MKRYLLFIIVLLFLFISCNNTKTLTKTIDETAQKTSETDNTIIETDKQKTNEIDVTPTETITPTQTNITEVELGNEKIKLIFDNSLGYLDFEEIEIDYQNEYTLPVISDSNFVYGGWRSSVDNKIYTIYPGFIVNYKEIRYELVIYNKLDLEEFLNEHFDVLDSDSDIYLENEYQNISLEWIIPDMKYLDYSNNFLKVNKAYQTHHDEKFTINLVATYPNGYKETLDKVVKVSPIVFPRLKATPIATYFSVGAMSSYKASSLRYKAEKTLFGESAKKTLDICYYAFITINSDATCQLGNPNVVDEILELRKSNIRIIGSIAGTSAEDSKLFAKFTSDEELLKEFVWNLVNLMELYNFDGLDIDWESTYEQYVVASGMTNLSKALRVELDSRQANNGSRYLLTAAVPASSWGAGDDRYNFKELDKYLDYINLMSYDANKSSVCSHVAPLYQSSYDNGYGFGCDYGVKLLSSKGFSASKIMIGVAGYGKAYKVTGTNSNEKYPYLGCTGSLTQISGVPDSFATGTIFNSAIVQLLKDSNYKVAVERNSSDLLVGAYLYNNVDQIFITFESTDLIRAKYEYASSSYGLGLMQWCYCEDTADWYVDTICEILYGRNE